MMKYFFGMLLLLAGGCYTYTPPSPVLLSQKFTSENKAATDKILLALPTLSLDNAKKIAALNNMNYQATLQNVNAAKMRYYQSLGAYAPEIHIGATVSHPSNWAIDMVNPPMDVAGREIAFSSQATASASWLLFDGFARYLNTQIRKHDYERETAVRMRVLCMLKRTVAYVYYDIQLAKEIQAIQERNIAFQEKLYRIVKQEEAAGKRPEGEVLNFYVEAGLGKTAFLAAQNQQEVADYSLAQLMGYSEGKLPGTCRVEPIPRQIERMYYDVEMCLDIALRNSPDMHIMEQLLEMSRLTKFRSYSAFFPVVTAFAEYRNLRMDANYRDFRHRHSSFTQNGFEYGVRADYLLFNGFARYNAMREAQTMYAAAEFNMGETYLQIVNAIRAAYATYETTYRQYLVYRELLDAARRQRDLVEAHYLRYHVSVDRMDKVQQYWISVETNFAVAITEFRKAIAQLEAIMMIDVYGRP